MSTGGYTGWERWAARVGKVLRCERNAESAVLWDIIVEPACDFEQLNDVIVIVMNPQK